MTTPRTTTHTHCVVVRTLAACFMLAGVLLFGALLALTKQAQAQTQPQAREQTQGVKLVAFPQQSITLIIPFPESGPTDTLGRVLAKHLGSVLGTSINIQNIAGAGGTLGTLRAAQANPDGYTLLFNHMGQATAPALYRRLRHNALTDFEPIGLMGDVPMTLIARPSFDPDTMADLISHLANQTQPVRYAHGGLGSASHLCGMLLQEALDVAFELHAYKGTGPAMQGLIQGNTDLLCDQTTNTTQAIVQRKVKAYAVSTRTQVNSLPWLPTLHKAGLNGFDMSVWHGLYAPRATPPNIIKTLSLSLQQVLQNPEFLLELEQLGVTAAEPQRANPEALRTHLELELERWAAVIHKNQQYAD